MRPAFPIANNPENALRPDCVTARSAMEAQAIEQGVTHLAFGFANGAFDTEAEARQAWARAIEAGFGELVPAFTDSPPPGVEAQHSRDRRWPKARSFQPPQWRLVVRFWQIATTGAVIVQKKRARRLETREGRIRSVKEQAPLDFGLFAGDYEIATRDDPSLLIPDE